MIVLLVSTSTTQSKAFSILCIENSKECYAIEDSASIHRFSEMTDSIYLNSMAFEVLAWEIYYIDGNRVLKHKRIDNGLGRAKFYSTLSKFIKSKKHVSAFEIACSLDLFNRILLGQTLPQANTFQINENANFSKVTVDFSGPDTLHFGLIDTETQKKLRSQLFDLAASYVPKRGQQIRSYLMNLYPSCLSCKYSAGSRRHTRNGNILVEKGVIEATFPVGFPCEYILNDPVAMTTGGFRCVRPDTLRLNLYCDRDSEQRLREVVNNENGFYGMKQLFSANK